MCVSTVVTYSCGCVSSMQQSLCPLPLPSCDAILKYPGNLALPTACDKHARLKSNRLSSTGSGAGLPQNVSHPALRGPAPAVQQAPAPAPRRSSRPTLLYNDLAGLCLEDTDVYCNLQDVIEIPHIPQFLPGATNAQQPRRPSSALFADAGVRKRTAVQPQQATTSAAAAAQHAAVLQQQAEVKRKREVREHCWNLLASGRYTYFQVTQLPMIAHLSEQEVADLFWEFQQHLKHLECHQAAPEAPRKHHKSSKCVVM